MIEIFSTCFSTQSRYSVSLSAFEAMALVEVKSLERKGTISCRMWLSGKKKMAGAGAGKTKLLARRFRKYKCDKRD